MARQTDKTQYYIEIDNTWHPTPVGHEQIFNRMISVLNGDKTYAGNINNPFLLAKKIIFSVMSRFKLQINSAQFYIKISGLLKKVTFHTKHPSAI